MATAKKTAAATTKPAAKTAANAATKKATPAKDKKTAEKAKEIMPETKKASAKTEKVKAPETEKPQPVAKPAKIARSVKAEMEPETVAAPVSKAKASKEEKTEEVKPASPAAAPAAKKAVEKKEPVKPVKIPKITAQGKVPYEPDFTHSVLDGPRDNAPVTTPTQRYSDSELAEFRELISRKLETARKELSYLQGLITRKDDSGGDGEDGRYMTMEDGTLSMEREQLSQMASRQITFIDHLEKAMIRIENKTYGICRETGKLIDKARLRAVPHATLSVEAKLKKGR